MVVLFAMRMPKLSRLAGGRAPKGRRRSHAHGNILGGIPGQHKRVGKKGKVTLVHGKPLRPFGPPPLQGGGVLPPDGQTLCCDRLQIPRGILALSRMSVTYLAVVRQDAAPTIKFLLNAQIHAVRSIIGAFAGKK